MVIIKVVRDDGACCLMYSQGDYTPLRFVSMCDNGVFNGRMLIHLSMNFSSLLVDKSYFDVFLSVLDFIVTI